MKVSTIIVLTASLILPHAALAAVAGPPDHSRHDCTQTCGQDARPAPGAGSPVIQTVARQASPGNKFPLPAPIVEQARQPQRAGTLAVRAVQGTPGAAPVGPVSIEIELYHRGMHVDTIEAQLDQHGVALIEEIPVAMGLQPIVKVAYSGVTYQKVGNLMDGASPHQMIEVVCYELTEEQPPWKVRMRHVMVSLAPDGVQVTEVVVVENPTARTWIGESRGQDKAVTTQFLLPTDALQVTLGRGFHEWCCTTLGTDRLENHIPLTPGATEMIYAYFVPVRKGSITLDIAAVTDVDHLMLIVPGSLTSASTSGLTAAGSDSVGDSAVRLYSAASLGPGEAARIVLTGLGADDAVASGAIAKLVAGVGGGLILIIAGILIFTRTPRPAQVTVTTSIPAAN